MELSDHHIKIIRAEICPYCGSSTEVKTELDIYGKNYRGRLVFCCVNFPSCDSYVGTHEDGFPLGRLANKELRKLKSEAHSYFDKIWKSGRLKRNEAYKKLSESLEIPEKYTHIGMFSESTCRKTISFAKEYLK